MRGCTLEVYSMRFCAKIQISSFILYSQIAEINASIRHDAKSQLCGITVNVIHYDGTVEVPNSNEISCSNGPCSIPGRDMSVSEPLVDERDDLGQVSS